MKSIVIALCLGCAYGDSFTCPSAGCAQDNVMMQALQRKATRVDDLFDGKVLKPGSIVAIHNDHFNRFVRLTDKGKVDGGGGHAKKIRPGWLWERFTVVDAGYGHIALYSAPHKRYIRMRASWMDAGGHMPANALRDDWRWERFQEVPLGGGHFALYSPAFKKFIRMEGGKVNSAIVIKQPILPKGWQWERFTAQVLKHAPIPPRLPRQLIPGRQVAIHNEHFNRFLRLTDKGKVDGGGGHAKKIRPGWQWERFTVVDVGHGLIALHSKAHNRFLRTNSKHKIDTCCPRAINTFPKWWGWEKFLEVPLGGGKFALYSTAFHRFIKMDHSNVYAGPPQIAPVLPNGWVMEMWTVQVLNAKPPKPQKAQKPKPPRRPQKSDYAIVKGHCRSGRIGPKECDKACSIKGMPMCGWDISGCTWIGDTIYSSNTEAAASDYGEICRKKR